MKTTQEQVDELAGKVFRLEAIATRLSKAEKQLAGLTRNDSWLADRCKDAADRLAKLESGKAEVQGGGELGEVRGALAAYAKKNNIDKLPTIEVVRSLLHNYHGAETGVDSTIAALGADYDDCKSLYDNVYDLRIAAIQARLERDEARAILAKSESDAASLSSEAVGARGEVRRLRAALENQREEIGKYNARVAKLEDELRGANAENEKLRVQAGGLCGVIVGLRKRVDVLEVALAERTDELSATQRLIAETDDIDDDAMVALGDPVKGAEAEELRRGVEDLVKAADSNDGVVSWHVLQSLLDRVNARDSNAFLAHSERAETGKPAPCHRCNVSDSERLYFWTCRECLGEPKTIDKAAALRGAGWEERVSGWSPDGGYSAWTLDGAYDAMLADRAMAPTLAAIATPKSAEEVIREAVAEAHAACVAFAADLATPRDTLADPGNLYIDDFGDAYTRNKNGTVQRVGASEQTAMPKRFRRATPEEAAKIRKDNGL